MIRFCETCRRKFRVDGRNHAVYCRPCQVEKFGERYVAPKGGTAQTMLTPREYERRMALYGRRAEEGIPLFEEDDTDVKEIAGADPLPQPARLDLSVPA